MSDHLRVLNWLKNYTYDDIKNCIIKENNAYTEDNVLIYNIYVNRIPNQYAEEDVRRYFSNFGKVNAVKLEEDKSRSRCAARKVGFVSFAKPESACSVLRRRNHRLEGTQIVVKAAHSWHQPNANKVCRLTKNEDDVPSTSKGSTKEAAATSSGTNMLSLNDDCLETIFGYLEFKEQVGFARVCERSQAIFKMLCKRPYKDFDLSTIRGLTLWETRDFFRFAGGNIASITGILPYKNHERIVEFISTFCGKLNSIRLDESEMRNECLKKLLRGCPQLQELSLRDCSLTDKSIQTMTHLNCLETLDLTENDELTGKFISKLVQLKVLNLYGCPKIQNSHLIDICKSLPKLRSLDIRQCPRLSPTFFDVMLRRCKELEILKMFCPDVSYECVALLPRLKRLELVCYYDTPQKRLLAELVAHKADELEVLKFTTLHAFNADDIAPISKLRQLKTLSVCDSPLVNDDALIKFCKLQQLEDLTIEGSSKITNQGLLNLVKSCQRLRRLNIELCKQITIEFLLETIRFLKASGKRKNPLVLKVYGTAMNYNEATKYEEFKDAEEQSLIRVVFHASNSDC